MSLYQGLLGAQVELAALPPSARLRRAAAIAKLFASELAGTVALAPYALRAATLHRALPAPSAGGAGDAHVTLERGVRYARAPRAVADVYMPPRSPRRRVVAGSNNAASPSPCAVFVHGGVWAAGEAFHYAPMAACLARLGVVTYVVTYTLYPDALVPALVGETAAALAFAMDDAPRRGGDPSRVALVGHSAGAHLAAMSLLYKAAAAAGVRAGAAAARAAAREEAAERQGGWGGGGGGGGAAAAEGGSSALAVTKKGPGDGDGDDTNNKNEEEDQDAAAAAAAANDDDDDDDEPPPSTVDELLLHPAIRDARMPALFVGAAGMYDAAKHYDFERRRGVHELSTLKRAMGGLGRFAAMSPSAILGAATATAGARARAARASSASSASSSSPLDATRFYEAAGGASGGSIPTPWRLAGEAIAHRVGLDRESDGYARRDSLLAGGLALAGMRDVLPFPVAVAEDEATLPPPPPPPQQQHPPISPAAPLLPPSVLMHAVGDATVPFDESTELHRRLLDAGATAGSKVLLYRGEGVGHASFVLDWPAAAGSRRWLAATDAAGAGAASGGGGWAGDGDVDAWDGGGDSAMAAEREEEDVEFWDLASELPPHCRDLALILTARADIDFCKPRRRGGGIGGNGEATAI